MTADVGDQVAEDCENVNPPEAKPVGTMRERPFPFGAPAPTVKGWTLRVVSSTPDATAAVLASTFENSGVIPDPFPDAQVFTGGQVEGKSAGRSPQARRRRSS